MANQIRFSTAIRYTSLFFDVDISENDGQSAAFEKLVVYSKRALRIFLQNNLITIHKMSCLGYQPPW